MVAGGLAGVDLPDRSIERLQAERDFHDQRYSDGDQRQRQMKYYWAVEDGAERFAALVAELAAGADVLEYGCGLGSRGAEFAPIAKSFHAIDISEAAIRQVGATVTAPNVHFEVMDAMKLEYPAGSFDLVYGSGIVHHLDTEVSAREVSRVLRPGGTALFWEPMGYNPLINAYRAMTPSARTVDEHPLLVRDFALMRRHFSTVEQTYFGLTSITSVPLRQSRIGRPIRSALQRLDRALFCVPGVRMMAWYALIRCER